MTFASMVASWYRYGIISGCLCVLLAGLYLEMDAKRRTSDEQEEYVASRSGSEVVVSSVRRGSAVFCQGDSSRTRSCRFKNLCYRAAKDEFIFFHGSETLAAGLPRQRFDPAFLDLSSVVGHNTQHFEYTDVPVSVLEEGSIEVERIERGRHIIFKRFNPGNLMHVIHDDLLPLYLTIRQHHLDCDNRERCHYRLVMMDDHSNLEGSRDFLNLYDFLAPYGFLMKQDLFPSSPMSLVKSSNSVVCFEDALIGLNKLPTWYQYGFNRPQGPISDSESNGYVLRQFGSFIRSKFGIKEQQDESEVIKLYPKSSIKPRNVVLLSRSMNRLILNENDLATTITSQLETRVHIAEVESMTLQEQIALVSNASILIGMHGSSLTLALFLREGSALLELFPYAVPAKEYTPYKTLTELPGMNVAYQYWENNNEDNTITHPDYEATYGGISHLDKEQQEKIKSSRRVEAHWCCENPEWLYRIYQDTFVDIPEVVRMVKKVWQSAIHIQDNLNKVQQAKASHIPGTIFPSKVKNVTCFASSDSVEASLVVSWAPSWNQQHIPGEVWYEVWIQEKGVDDYNAYKLQATEFAFTHNIRHNANYIVWVRSVIGNLEGPFSGSVLCDT
ncbi:protein O-linked-mannose beta-1,4-N-acetylglucosaminyltransferase 2-like [Corticium candelabrum]|uniref:protein O-linked-mannose beta-1,4-N-acetylglucosaminyltransferase 2-like n=1 Tax=Corticium candelabrum TaxID=121492 RepID=UPI002E35261D|nr:protein O-linked-mannose beta-1,4-N-acetylglucosaminyltransferase 2-like [Corticium candelabrum]